MTRVKQRVRQRVKHRRVKHRRVKHQRVKHQRVKHQRVKHQRAKHPRVYVKCFKAIMNTLMLFRSARRHLFKTVPTSSTCY